MLNALPAERDLVFVGGGHAHALALRALAMRPVGGLRITLISPASFTPYSGMLPGLLAGHYDFQDAHIDLARLCQLTGVRFLADEVQALDPKRRELTCAKRGVVAYDYLSLDIGSQPELDSVPGAREHATPVKPVAGLWSRWEGLLSRDLEGQRIAIVGGGAGSVEVALAMAYRLSAQRPKLTLYCGSQRLLEGYSGGSRRAAEAACARYGVAVRCGRRVRRVDADMLYFDDETAPFDTLIWSTGAAAAPWIAQSGLPVDERGFMLVEDTLQSTAFPEIFGAGDIATQHRHPRPKAGVYAVRQGPVLAANLAAIACGDALREHRPQRRFLSLLSLGDRRAVAERHGISAAGGWAWTWKDRIDRAFMERFSGLSATEMAAAAPARQVRADSNSPSRSVDQMPCGGCGAKVGANTLHETLDRLRDTNPDLVPPADARDDAVSLDAQGAIVQSVDVLRPLIDDPWRMGRIAAQHALSDLYAMGATPRSAQAVITLPFAAPALLWRDLDAILGGALSVFAESSCRLIGGHTMQGAELQVGFVVNGELEGRDPMAARGARPGDQLLLSAALGSGALFAAHMQGRADGRHIDTALTAMERGNAAAANTARQAGATGLTDVTGFGLVGHLLPMLGADLCAEVALGSLPVLPGALEALSAGVRSTMQAANETAFAPRVQVRGKSTAVEALLYDPQTCGGLLMAVPPERASAALEELQAAGLVAARIGEVRPIADKSAAATPGREGDAAPPCVFIEAGPTLSQPGNDGSDPCSSD